MSEIEQEKDEIASRVPTLQLRRLRVLKSGRPVYDQAFHEGVNIIRGDNGSGKSSIADFAFFVLGGEFDNWKKVPAQCDEIQAEILTSQGRLALKRNTDSKTSPIRVFFGTLKEGVEAGSDGWERFPVHRQGDHESFSQLLFRSMLIPEAKSEGASNITMHQILRLLYSDQHTPPGRLFRFESTWDTKTMRSAVGDLLCGVNDYEGYEISLEIRELERHYDEVSRQLSALLSILPSDETLNKPATLEMEIREREAEREAALQRISQVDDLIDGDEVKEFLAKSRSMRDRILKSAKQIGALEREVSQLGYQLGDLEEYLDFLSEMIEKVGLAESSQLAIGDIDFTHCPACLTDLAPTVDGHTCHVCNSEIDPEDKRSRYNAIRVDFEMQQREARQLNSQKEMRLSAEKAKLRKARAEHSRLIAEFAAGYDNGSSPREAFLAEQNLRIGQIAREIDYLEKSLVTASRVKELSEAKADAQAELDKLKSRQEALELSAAKRRSVALSRVSRIAASVLRADNMDQPEFMTAQDVSVNFSDDAMSVDGDLNFAESSNVILKNACILSLLLAAGEDQKFFHPRFALFDNIEDKGMQTERSHNFQRILVEMVTELSIPFQVIYTTSMMNPDLELDNYVIGPHYTKSNRSLEGLE